MPIATGKIALKAAIKTRVYNALKKANATNGKSNPQADKTWLTQAEAISEIAEDIANFLLTEVQVAPGISSAGSGGGVPGPVATVSTSPGKLI